MEIVTLSIIFIVIGVFLFYLGYKIVDNKRQYEFKNRNSNGVVQFKNYGDSQYHNFMKGLGVLVGMGGIIFIAIGVGLFVIR
ncbi:hypothetical protein [uncultured Dokdonia sp.]|uniref:hypothetical protein n=1 Tax=uncultured Dokdonia sp. TaxID=575653 RepID=UPI00262D0765|nr:hypothetical protein [uncultured Dokdonia sp.]